MMEGRHAYNTSGVVTGQLSQSWNGKGYSRIARYLPSPSIINEPTKTAGLIPISSKGVGGGNDFRCSFLKEVSLPPECHEAIRSKIVDVIWRWECY
jgi:hypothetical protein